MVAELCLPEPPALVCFFEYGIMKGKNLMDRTRPRSLGRAWIRALAFLLCSVAISGISVTPASAAKNSPQRDAAALTALQNAITALGGTNAVAAIQDCILTGSVAYGDGTSRTFTWTIAGVEFRRETTTANGTVTVFLSGHGSPAWLLGGNTTSLSSFMGRANFPLYLPPYALFQELSNPVYTIRYVGPTQVNGVNVLQIHISDDSDAAGALVTPQEWFLDPVSFLPVQVQFRQPSNENAADYVNTTFAFSKWMSLTGVLVPSAISYTQDNLANETILISGATFNTAVPPQVFDPPQGGAK